MKHVFSCSHALWASACLLGSSVAMAAPVKTSSSLPLEGADLEVAKGTLATAEELQDFAFFIKSIDVFPDHENPKNVEGLSNRSLKKTYYIAPFYQASEKRPVVGGQEIAGEGIKIIAECYDLISSFDYELFKIGQLGIEKEKKEKALDNLNKNLNNPAITDPLTKSTTAELIKSIAEEIRDLKAKIAELETRAETGIGETSTGLKKQVISQIMLKLSFLGVTPSGEEQSWFDQGTAQSLRLGIGSMIRRATAEGQYGYRSAVFESGYTKKQSDWIALYRRIRSDVQVAPLAANKVYARSTALTSKTSLVEPGDYFLGDAKVVNAPRLFLAVNGGSGGACGNTKSCNVTIEYTWLGATMARTSKTGSIIMPVYFEADVAFMQPDFEGTVSCDFTTGFKVQGRADVKDGAVIYDGDVYNKINYEVIENGACNYTIEKGDGNSAAYHAIRGVYDHYMRLKTDRAAKSMKEMDEYRNYVNKELDYHARQSQKKDYDMWSLSTWTSAFGGTWGTVASFVVGGARNFYWHTRVEDSTVTAPVKFTTTIRESNVQKTERMAFDGMTVLCWKPDEAGTPILAACPSQALPEYQKKADTDLGKNQQLCGADGVSGDCVAEAEKNEKKPETDGNGVIADPWA